MINFDIELQEKKIEEYKEKYKVIGKGAGRIVFDIGKNKVMKVAYNYQGVHQNNTEIRISNSGAYSDIIAKAKDNKDYSIIMEKGVPLETNRQTDALLGMQRNFFKHYCNNRMKGHFNPSEFAQKLKEMCKRFGLQAADFGKKEAFCTFQDGSIKVIDYGYDVTMKYAQERDKNYLLNKNN